MAPVPALGEEKLGAAGRPGAVGGTSAILSASVAHIAHRRPRHRRARHRRARHRRARHRRARHRRARHRRPRDRRPHDLCARDR